MTSATEQLANRFPEVVFTGDLRKITIGPHVEIGEGTAIIQSGHTTISIIGQSTIGKHTMIANETVELPFFQRLFCCSCDRTTKRILSIADSAIGSGVRIFGTVEISDSTIYHNVAIRGAEDAIIKIANESIIKETIEANDSSEVTINKSTITAAILASDKAKIDLIEAESPCTIRVDSDDEFYGHRSQISRRGSCYNMGDGFVNPILTAIINGEIEEIR
jgi:carbonic anhydrase/acetyltransferase-like protein (isoleucine patch superfamily)